MVWRGVWFVLVASAHAAPTYVGALVCAKCHAETHRKWSQSRHSKMVQPATPAAVKGDFARGEVTLRGQPYLVRESDGAYYITESYLSGKPQEHRIDYTLGNRRIQHYLTTLPDGRVIVLPPSWDVLRKDWFHNLDIADPDEVEGVQVQVWNKSCQTCHVSQQEKNFDVEKIEYKTAWLDFGTNCERCHGPGSEHVVHYSSATPPKGPAKDIVVQTSLDPARNTMVCGQCHSFRDIYKTGYSAGADYYDYFLPILEYDQPVDKDPAYWPDGRTRRFSNDAFGLWQSECFLKGGATCVGCHGSGHEPEIDKNPQLRPDASALCTGCHAKIGTDIQAHTHHPVASVGSSCVECHMPRTVYSIKAEIRDHSMSIPVPENTIRHAIPNACNLCHKDRDPAWSIRQMNAWYGDRSRQKLIRRADAFALARAGNPRAIPSLRDILAEPAEGPLVRANATGYLSQFSYDPTVFATLLRALSDPQPLVRMMAARRLNPGPADREAAVKALVPMLGDPNTPARVGAAVSLIALGVTKLAGDDGQRLESAKEIFRARAEQNSDDADQDLAAGRFYLLTEDPARAIRAFQTSLKLDPAILAQCYLASAYAEKGQFDEARKILESVDPRDPQYAQAQKMLKSLTR